MKPHKHADSPQMRAAMRGKLQQYLAKIAHKWGQEDATDKHLPYEKAVEALKKAYNK